jgi:hypothetical protein
MPGEGLDFPLPYLRAYFRKQGVAGSGIHVVSSELTLAGLMPRLTGLQPQADRSRAEARHAVTALVAAL